MEHEPGAGAPASDPAPADTPAPSAEGPEVAPHPAPASQWMPEATSDPAPVPGDSEPTLPGSATGDAEPDLEAVPVAASEVPTDEVPPVDSDAREEPPPSWAWSTESRATSASVPPPVDTRPSANGDRRGGIRSALVGGIAGALVGALIAGGLVVAFDDDPSPRPVAAQTATSSGEDAARRTSVTVESGDIRSILEAARPAVVRIDVGGRARIEGTGTGFIIDSNGVIVTNAHVVEGNDTVEVHLADGRALRGEVVGADSRLDLAVVEVDETGLPTLELGDSDTLQVGDAVIAIGNALGLSEGSGATVTTGIISGLDRVVDVGDETLFNAIQTDAAINPGNSGGPLVDSNGRVVGINTAIASPGTSNNVGFAISISSAKPVIDALREGEEPKIAFLGVTSEPLTADVAEELGVDQGAVVVDVASGSGAADAGIERGDVIVEVAGTAVDSVEDVASAVRKQSPGDQIEVVVVRAGDEQRLTVTLGERPDDT
jgi:S1-C subfamily serine protease